MILNNNIILKKNSYIVLNVNNIVYKLTLPHIKNRYVLYNYWYKHKLWDYKKNATKRK